MMIHSSVVKKTPVDTGRARGNWVISKGSPDTSVTDRTDKKDKGSASSFSEDEKAKIKDAGDATIYIQNNLPYIQSLEYGHSKQAPQGMVGLTMAHSGEYWERAVAQVTNKKGGKK